MENNENNKQDNLPDPENTIYASNGVGFETLISSTVMEAPQNTWGAGVGYPSIIEIQHSEKNKGKLLAAFSVSDSGLRGKPTSLRVMESTDGGKTWIASSGATENAMTSKWTKHHIIEPDGVDGNIFYYEKIIYSIALVSALLQLAVLGGI